MITEYRSDKQEAPVALRDLVSNGYLREIPDDPITGSKQSWKIKPGVWDVRSRSDKTSLDGSPYADG